MRRSSNPAAAADSLRSAALAAEPQDVRRQKEPTGLLKRRYEIDGARFVDLQGFYDEVSRKLIPGASWGRNLDAFNDVLRGGFGTPPEGFTLVWQNSAISRSRLGHAEYAKLVEEQLTRYRTGQRLAELEAARSGRGRTMFDVLLEIVQGHPEVELILE